MQHKISTEIDQHMDGNHEIDYLIKEARATAEGHLGGPVEFVDIKFNQNTRTLTSNWKREWDDEDLKLSKWKKK